MTHVLKIDERAFNEGVRDVLTLKPLVRVAKVALSSQKDKKKQTDKSELIVRRQPK